MTADSVSPELGLQVWSGPELGRRRPLSPALHVALRPVPVPGRPHPPLHQAVALLLLLLCI